MKYKAFGCLGWEFYKKTHHLSTFLSSGIKFTSDQTVADVWQLSSPATPMFCWNSSVESTRSLKTLQERVTLFEASLACGAFSLIQGRGHIVDAVIGTYNESSVKKKIAGPLYHIQARSIRPSLQCCTTTSWRRPRFVITRSIRERREEKWQPPGIKEN